MTAKANEHGVFEDRSDWVEIPIPKACKVEIGFQLVECEDGWRYGAKLRNNAAGQAHGTSWAAAEDDSAYPTRFNALQDGCKYAVRWLTEDALIYRSIKPKAAKLMDRAIDAVEAWLKQQETEPSSNALDVFDELHAMPPNCQVVLVLRQVGLDAWDYGLRITIGGGKWGYDMTPGGPRPMKPAPPSALTQAAARRLALLEAKETVSDYICTLKPKTAQAKLAQQVWDRFSEVLVSHELLTPRGNPQAEPEGPKEEYSYAVGRKESSDSVDPKADFERRKLAAQLAVGQAAQAADEAKDRWNAAKKACGLGEAQKALSKARTDLAKLVKAGPEYLPLIDGKKGGQA